MKQYVGLPRQRSVCRRARGHQGQARRAAHPASALTAAARDAPAFVQAGAEGWLQPNGRIGGREKEKSEMSSGLIATRN